MAIDFNSVKDLPPEQRAEEIRKIIELLKKEIEEREEDIKTAEHLIGIAENESIVIEREELSGLLKTTTKKEKPLEKELETLIQQERVQRDEIQQLAKRPIAEIYTEVRAIYANTQQGNLSNQDKDRLYTISQIVYQKQKDIEQGKYNAGNQAGHLLNAAEELIKRTEYESRHLENTYKST
ncbi:hypothetical protein COV18_07615 [Candidatus Woesearchaeota archaeon CG10_big_fil_rev_8_21_14_0_10_37_12]|nr:MAG: hypothetical protein COV18_07615 [Candidatus Woesearchaeota archaeon CG10_big_fil_rev_8_21_14_0_10_37_12]